MMFVKIGKEYLNLDQIVRVLFENGTATVFFAKPGGSDRHILTGAEAKLLEKVMESCNPIREEMVEPAPQDV